MRRKQLLDFAIAMLLAAALLVALFVLDARSASGEGERNPWPAQDRPLPCIRQWETGGGTDPNGDYSDDKGKYQTAYQFDAPTWDSNAKAGPHTDWVGRMTEAARTRPDIVDSQARVTVSRRGLQPWPTPRKKCR